MGAFGLGALKATPLQPRRKGVGARFRKRALQGARKKDGKEEPGLKPKIPADALRAALKGGAPPTQSRGLPPRSARCAR